MDYNRIPININAATHQQIDASGKVITSESSYMRLVYSEMCVVCVTFYDVTESSDGTVTMTTHAIPSSATLTIAGDSDFDETTALMFKSSQTGDDANRIDVAGDWIGGATADRSKGQTSFRINTRTAKFIGVLTTSKYSNSKCYCAIEMLPAGSTEFSALASFPFTAINRVTSEAAAPAEDDPAYLNKSEILALLKLAREHRYCATDSATDSDWHTIQTAADRYCQERYPGGEWSASIRLPGPHPQGVYNSAATYYLNDLVKVGGAAYRSLTDANTGNAPATATAYWELFCGGLDETSLAAVLTLADTVSGKMDVASRSLALPAATPTPLALGTGKRYLVDLCIDDGAGHYWEGMVSVNVAAESPYVDLNDCGHRTSAVPLTEFDPDHNIGALAAVNTSGALALTFTLAAGADRVLSYKILTSK